MKELKSINTSIDKNFTPTLLLKTLILNLRVEFKNTEHSSNMVKCIDERQIFLQVKVSLNGSILKIRKL